MQWRGARIAGCAGTAHFSYVSHKRSRYLSVGFAYGPCSCFLKRIVQMVLADVAGVCLPGLEIAVCSVKNAV